MIKNKLSDNEKGFAAIVIAMTLVIILSLLTIGFAQIIRNESRQALNRQLSSQANFAAESGVNDAIRAIKAGYVGTKSTCGPILAPTGAETYLADNTVNSDTAANTKWTCLLINSAPNSVEYSSVDTVTPTVFTVNAVDASSNPVAVNSITVAWQDADSTVKASNPASGVTNNSFPKASNWSAPGLLRLAVTPFNTIDRTALIQNTFTAFLYPNKNVTAGVLTDSPYTNNQAQSGPIVDGNCNIANTVSYTRYCIARITFSPAVVPGNKLLFNLRSIYSNTNVHITANNGAAWLVGAQTLIDSTGKSQDVLKRIQVRVPTNDPQLYPGFGLDSITGICKQLSVYPGAATSSCSVLP